MKEILKMKFKAHRLVNYLFYVIIFFVGFFIGFGAKNLNIKNIISQLMFIDNVEARTIATVNGTPIDEDYVYSRFKEKWENFDINIYNKISCGWFNNTTKSLHCVALTTNAFNNKTFVAKDSNVTYNGTNVFRVRYSIPNNKTDAYEFMYETSTNTYTSSKLYDSSTVSDSNLNYFSFYFNNWQSGVSAASNFSVSEVSSSEDSYFNAFDFSKYIEYTITENNNNIKYTYTFNYADLKDLPTTSNWSQEDYIYNLFNTVNNKFDLKLKFKDFSYVFAVASKNTYSFYFSKSEFYKTDYYHLYVNNDYLYINIDKDDQDIYLSYTQNKVSNYANILFSNGIKSDKFATTSASMDDSRIVKRLDFSKYTLNYHLNDGSIFEDENHQDFNKICWENFDELMFAISIDKSYNGSFTITEDGQQDGETYVNSGFYVFDDISKLQRGTRSNLTGDIDSDIYSSTFISGFKFSNLKNITNQFMLLDTDENINIRYSDIIDALGNYDLERGDSYYYDNLSKLENSFYVDFTYYYNVLNDYKYDIFNLKEKKEKFCIYIPKQFKVTTLKINELGGIIGDVPLHDDSDDSYVDRTEINSKMSFNTLFSIINKFIDSIKGTVNFINSNIYSFFLSLPPIVQMFIYTILTLIVIKTIIWMVVR